MHGQSGYANYHTTSFQQALATFRINLGKHFWGGGSKFLQLGTCDISNHHSLFVTSELIIKCAFSPHMDISDLQWFFFSFFFLFLLFNNQTLLSNNIAVLYFTGWLFFKRLLNTRKGSFLGCFLVWWTENKFKKIEEIVFIHWYLPLCYFSSVVVKKKGFQMHTFNQKLKNHWIIGCPVIHSLMILQQFTQLNIWNSNWALISVFQLCK